MYRAHITQKDGPERTQEVREKLVTVGRAEEGNVLVLPRGNVSKSHATLEFLGDSWVLSDLASTNGTYLNGKRIGQPSTVWPGDRIHIGDFMMRFELLDGPDSVSEVSALEIDLESDESDEFDDNPTAFRAEGLSAAAVVPNRRSTAASLLATHASTAQDADLAPVADGDDPPTAGLMHHNVAPMVNADTRKASVRLSLVSLIERFLATPKALQKAAVLARGAASSAELRSGLEQAFSDLRLSGEISANAVRDELIAAAHNELYALGPLAMLVEPSGWSEVTARGAGELVVIQPDNTRSRAVGFSTQASFLAGLRRLRVMCSGVVRKANGGWDGVLNGCSVQVLRNVAGVSLHVRRYASELLTLEAMVLRGHLDHASMALAEELVGGPRNVLLLGEPKSAMLLALASLRAVSAKRNAVLVTQNTALAASACGVLSVSSVDERDLFERGDALLFDGPSVQTLRRIVDAALMGGTGITVVLPGHDARDIVSRAALALSLQNDAGGMASNWQEALEIVFDRFVTLDRTRLSVAGAL